MTAVPLHHAVLARNVDQLQTLLQSPDRSISARDTEGATPLFVAAKQGDAAMVKILLQAGSKANAKNRKKWTPLHASAFQGNTEVAKLLLKAGAGLSRETCRKQTPYMVACNKLNIEMAKFLLVEGSPVVSRSMFDRTPLHWAIKTRNLELVKQVVQKGADLEAIDIWAKAPIFEAVRCNAPAIVEYLIQSGAKNIDIADRYGRKPIHYAAIKGYAMCMEVLVKHGIPVDSQMRNGSTPLMLASAECRLKVIEWLLSNGAKVSITDKSKSTPLHRVIIERQGRSNDTSHRVPWAGSTFAILRANPDVDAETNRVVFWDRNNRDPSTALEIATKANFTDLVELLCAAGASLGKVKRYFGLSKDALPPAFGKDDTALKWLQEYFGSPRDLKLMCRTRVRQLIGSRFSQQTLQSLNIPQSILAYLMLDDLKPLVAKFDQEILNPEHDDGENVHYDEEADVIPSEDEYEPSEYDSDLYGNESPVDTDDEMPK